MNSIDKIKRSLIQYHQFQLTSNRNKEGKQLQEETLDLLYYLEDHHKYDETDIGRRIGLLINKIQK
tara:strand:- start:1672 stop:1869 length:198 start_codon:yes stop_codon:yes gene_type:complete